MSIGDPMPDCPDDEALAEVEKAYRRGFQQGAAIALGAVENGARMSALLDWACGALFRWRKRSSRWKAGDLVRVEFPAPAPQRASKKRPQRGMTR